MAEILLRRLTVPLAAGFIMALASSAAGQTTRPCPGDVAVELRDIAAELDDTSDLLDALGSDNYAIRENATRQLSRLRLMPIAELQALLDDPDAEKRFRADWILKQNEPEPTRLEELLDCVKRKSIPGLARELLVIIEFAYDPDLQFAIQEALIATLRPGDFPLLKSAVKNSRPQVRAVAATALGYQERSEAVDEILLLVNDPEPKIRLAVAGALARHRHPRCLTILVDLLLEEDKSLREVAATTLQAVTGRNHGYFDARNAEQRKAVSERWREWIAQQGSELKLREIRQVVTTASPFD